MSHAATSTDNLTRQPLPSVELPASAANRLAELEKENAALKTKLAEREELMRPLDADTINLLLIQKLDATTEWGSHRPCPLGIFHSEVRRAIFGGGYRKTSFADLQELLIEAVHLIRYMQATLSHVYIQNLLDGSFTEFFRPTAAEQPCGKTASSDPGINIGTANGFDSKSEVQPPTPTSSIAAKSVDKSVQLVPDAVSLVRELREATARTAAAQLFDESRVYFDRKNLSPESIAAVKRACDLSGITFFDIEKCWDFKPP